MHRNRANGYAYKANKLEGFQMRTLNEAAIDKIVAACNGDLRGALQALLLAI